MGIPLGGVIPIQLQLSRGETNRFPLAHVYDASGSEISGSPVALVHLANGLYRNTSLTMPSTAFVMAQYLVYTDSGHTTLDGTYQYSEEEFEFLPEGNLPPVSKEIVEVVGYVVQSVGPVNNSPIPDQQAINVVQGEDITIQVRLKNSSNFQPYYLSDLVDPHGVTAQFTNSDDSVVSVDGVVQDNDASLIFFPLSHAQTAALMLGVTQNFQVTITRTDTTVTIVPMNGAINVTAQI